MAATKKELQRRFQEDEERLQSCVHAVKIDGRKKKHATYLCLVVTIEVPIAVRLYFVKGDRDEIHKKKDRFQLRDVKEVDGINLKKPNADFRIVLGEKPFLITASSLQEKEDFIKELYKLCSHNLPVQMPDFCNVSLPVDHIEATIIPVEAKEGMIRDPHHDYQPISTKEESDFRNLLAASELKIHEADKFAEVLTSQLQSLDGANIQSMLGSEAAVTQLIGLLDDAMKDVELLEKEVDACDEILAVVRNSVELIEEKDSLSVVERRNKERLRKEFEDFIKALDSVTDAHITVLKEARLDDASSISRCADAAWAVSKFWKGTVPKALVQMRAYREKADKLDVVDLFVDRLVSHFTALFNNLNELSSSQDWHHLSLPKQSQRFHALSPLSDLMSWLKINRPSSYQAAYQRYTEATKVLYRNIFDQFFTAIYQEVHQLPSNKSTLNASTRSTSDKTSLDITISSNKISELIETVLGEIGPVVETEQKFCVRFFHINSELVAHADTLSTGSGDSVTAGRNSDRAMNEQVRSIMTPLMESLNDHLNKFADAICRQNPSNVLLLFVILSKKVLSPQDSTSYFAFAFGTLVVQVKRKSDQYMENEGKQLADMRVPKRMRVGILPNIEHFSEIIRNAERVFLNTDRRTDLEKWYSYLFNCVVEGIEKAATSSNSKSPPAVVRFENFHQLYLTLSELKLHSLEVQRKHMRQQKSENITIYVRESLGKPLEKVHHFFENINSAIQSSGIKSEEISYQPQFSRIELKKVINCYPPKEVKKGLEQLYKRVEKQLMDDSSLLQVVWREMQDQFIKQIQEYQTLMAKCYPGVKVDLEVSINDVLAFFSEIAQQH